MAEYGLLFEATSKCIECGNDVKSRGPVARCKAMQGLKSALCSVCARFSGWERYTEPEAWYIAGGLAPGDLVEVVDIGNGRAGRDVGRRGRIVECLVPTGCVLIDAGQSDPLKIHSAYVKKIEEAS